MLGIALNVAYVIVEFVAGLLVDSLALIADAAHNASDVLGLLLALVAVILGDRAATRHRTYGLGRVSIMAALISGLLLALTLGALAWEAIGRLQEPQPLDGQTVSMVALVGVGINGLTAWLLVKGSQDLNIRAAFLHMMADALVSLAVVVAGVIVWKTQWWWVDPALTLLVIVVIFYGTWDLIREALHLSLDGVPRGVDIDRLEDELKTLPEVKDVHDLHVWALSTSDNALTVHLVVDALESVNEFLARVQTYLAERHGIRHATIQIEYGQRVDHGLDPNCL
ncbi:MAG: cation transporter [Gammaproteobacteria bacterium]|nr:MAG: cation transporter [Gammaproteobacteria bacterium]